MSMVSRRRAFPERAPRRFLLALVVVLALLVAQFISVLVGAARTSDETRVLNEDVFNYVADVTIERVSTYAKAAETLVSDVSNGIELHDDDAHFSALLEEIYLGMELRPYVRAVYVGYPDGGLVSLLREETGYQGSRLLGQQFPEPRSVTIHYDFDFAILSYESGDAPDYDPRTREWYANGELSSVPSWAEPQLSFLTREPMASVSQGLRADGELVAVVGTDLLLAELAPLLDKVPVGDGEVLVFDSHGNFIAGPSSYGELAMSISDATGAVPTAADFGVVLADGVDGTFWLPASIYVTDANGASLQRGFPATQGHSWVLYMKSESGSLSPGIARVNSNVSAVTVTVALLAIAATLVMGIMWRPLRMLRAHAHRDPLTGLPNKFAHDEYGPSLVSDAHKAGKRLCVTILDIDQLDSVNQREGYEVADSALSAVANALREATERTDLVARIGGDEFAVVQRIARSADPLAAVERIRAHTERALLSVIPQDGELAGVGVTAGFAVSAEEFHSLSDLERDADAALAEGKLIATGATYAYRDPNLASYEPRHK